MKILKAFLYALTSVLILFLPLTVGAKQQAMAQMHVHPSSSPADIIDGRVHPELIPDSTAYRLYFIAVAETPYPGPNEARRQHAHLAAAGLAGGDLQVASEVLASFKIQYQSLIDQYNNSAAVRSGSSADLSMFLAKREALVQATRDELKSQLTPAGMTKLDVHIQKEKANMRVAKGEAQ